MIPLLNASTILAMYVFATGVVVIIVIAFGGKRD